MLSQVRDDMQGHLPQEVTAISFTTDLTAELHCALHKNGKNDEHMGNAEQV